LLKISIIIGIVQATVQCGSTCPLNDDAQKKVKKPAIRKYKPLSKTLFILHFTSMYIVNPKAKGLNTTNWFGMYSKKYNHLKLLFLSFK